MEQLSPWRGGDLELLSVHERGVQSRQRKMALGGSFCSSDWNGLASSVQLAAFDHTVHQCYEAGLAYALGYGCMSREARAPPNSHERRKLEQEARRGQIHPGATSPWWLAPHESAEFASCHQAVVNQLTSVIVGPLRQRGTHPPRPPRATKPR